ncbi:hypothetical protein MSC49_40880 (plasmid) [Methylosinus sp. C49]|nr:hypothetical protein MSC49_40880 [Methylosinus sp. C49]
MDTAAGFDAERQAEMGFPRAGRSDEMDGFVAIDELQLGERHDVALVERGLKEFACIACGPTRQIRASPP